MTSQRNRTLTIAFAIVTLWIDTGRAQVRIAPPAAPVAPPIASPVAPPIKPVGLLPVPVGPITTAPPPPQPGFYVRSYLGKCLDFAPPHTPFSAQVVSQVAISDCNGSATQQILVEEVDSHHDVVLHAGSKVIGITYSNVKTLAPGDLSGNMAATSGNTPLVFGLELQDRLAVTAI